MNAYQNLMFVMSTLDVTMFQEAFSVSVTLVTVVMVEHVSVSYNFLFPKTKLDYFSARITPSVCHS